MNYKDLGLKEDQNLFTAADHHLGEPRMGIMQRPFPDAMANFVAMRENHNLVVKPSDLVIFNGDVVSLQAPNPEDWLKRIDTFNGRKWLVRGNHDIKWSNADLAPYFERVINHGDGVEIDIEPGQTKQPQTAPWLQKPLPKDVQELHLFFTHYPTRSRVDRFNIVGHIHSAWKVQKNMLNVGVDVHHYYPVAAFDIPFYIAAITSFYDDDVWVGNNRANAMYTDIRGKQGSYFASKEAD